MAQEPLRTMTQPHAFYAEPYARIVDVLWIGGNEFVPDSISRLPKIPKFPEINLNLTSCGPTLILNKRIKYELQELQLFWGNTSL